MDDNRLPKMSGKFTNLSPVHYNTLRFPIRAALCQNRSSSTTISHSDSSSWWATQDRCLLLRLGCCSCCGIPKLLLLLLAVLWRRIRIVIGRRLIRVNHSSSSSLSTNTPSPTSR